MTSPTTSNDTKAEADAKAEADLKAKNAPSADRDAEKALAETKKVDDAALAARDTSDAAYLDRITPKTVTVTDEATGIVRNIGLVPQDYEPPQVEPDPREVERLKKLGFGEEVNVTINTKSDAKANS